MNGARLLAFVLLGLLLAALPFARYLGHSPHSPDGHSPSQASPADHQQNHEH